MIHHSTPRGLCQSWNLVIFVTSLHPWFAGRSLRFFAPLLFRERGQGVRARPQIHPVRRLGPALVRRVRGPGTAKPFMAALVGCLPPCPYRHACESGGDQTGFPQGNARRGTATLAADSLSPVICRARSATDQSRARLNRLWPRSFDPCRRAPTGMHVRAAATRSVFHGKRPFGPARLAMIKRGHG